MKQTDWISLLKMRARQFWLRLSPAGRGIAVMLVLCGVLGVPLGRGYVENRRVVLFQQDSLSSLQLQRMETVWAKAGLMEYSIEQGQVKVPWRSKGRYLTAVADAQALPPTLGSSVNDAINDGHVLESPQQRQSRMQLIRDQQLANIIKSIEGVEDAAIRIEESKPVGFKEHATKKAMVIVRPGGDRILRPDRIHTIRNLVAESTVGLRVEDVSVADLGLSYVYHGDLAIAIREAPAWASSKWKKDFESEWVRRVASLIEPQYQPSVSVNATLVEGRLFPRDVEIAIELPRAALMQQLILKRPSGNSEQNPPTAGDLERFLGQIQQDIDRRLAILSQGAQEDANASEPARTLASIKVTLGEQIPRPGVFTEKFAWDQPNSLVAATILSMAAIGVVAIGIGFLRDLATTAPRKAVSPQDTRMNVPREIFHGNELGSLAAAARDPTAEEPTPASSTVIQEELTNLMRDDPKAAAELLRRWAKDAA